MCGQERTGIRKQGRAAREGARKARNQGKVLGDRLQTISKRLCQFIRSCASVEAFALQERFILCKPNARVGGLAWVRAMGVSNIGKCSLLCSLTNQTPSHGRQDVGKTFLGGDQLC